MPALVLRKTCRACQGPNIELALPLTPTPVGDAYFHKGQEPNSEELFPIELWLCHDCGLAQLPHVVDPAILYGNFTYRTSISLGLVDHFAKYAEQVLERVALSAGALAVDIGSNDGTLLGFFKQRGLRVLGIDPAATIAREATQRGIETLPTYFTEELATQLVREYGAAELMTSNNTFANIDNLPNFIAAIRTLLAPQGVFVLETGYGLDLVEHGLFDNIYHEHLSYFSVSSLCRLFEGNGMQLFDVERIATKGGSLRAYIQPIGGRHSVHARVGELMDLEKSHGLEDLGSFKKLSERLAHARDELHGEIDRRKAQRGLISGFGASVGVTTFLYHFALKGKLDFLIDDNPIKDGVFSPGLHLPVYNSRDGFGKRPDSCVILAWRYAEPIMAKHRNYTSAGGTFIVPYPKLKLVTARG